MNEAEASYSEKITFEYYDITKAENDALATKYKVYLTPTFVILSEDEKELDRLIGEVPEKTLRTFITKNVDKYGKKTTE